jgi:hypothetical protein
MEPKAATREPGHSGWKVVLRTGVAGMAMLHAALEAAVGVRNR